MCMYVCKYACACVGVCVGACVYVCVYVYMYVCTCDCVYRFLRLRLCPWVCACVCVCCRYMDTGWTLDTGLCTRQAPPKSVCVSNSIAPSNKNRPATIQASWQAPFGCCSLLALPPNSMTRCWSSDMPALSVLNILW